MRKVSPAYTPESNNSFSVFGGENYGYHFRKSKNQEKELQSESIGNVKICKKKNRNKTRGKSPKVVRRNGLVFSSCFFLLREKRKDILQGKQLRMKESN